ncbi:heat shock factor protein-like isoform X2 [Venturia canescens]|uniref:heat shock factor protein-like isoform X2 n=1 Tax=Venturia canescens TaxID=32260 RepID=UPI001C9BD475|nr:heat shock factor protein-like isoform X2 [Venturia canescens]
MHPVTELETSVPAFLGKLWRLVEDPETDDLICWAPNGRSFFIRNQAQFARELLPHYYKHNNMASFVRQLNMYGFHKKVSVELGGLKCDRDEMEFAHQYFIKDHPYLLDHIKRKIASTKSQDSGRQPMKSEMMNKVLSEVRTMRGRQEHLDSRLGAMKRENEALWRELAMLRRKHLKQQEIVNKLIHFLVTLVQPTRSGGLPVKRRYPLMIDNANHVRNKQSKLSKPEASPTGPVIHELDASEHDMDPEYINIDMFDGHSNPAIQSPEQDEFSAMADDNLVTVEMMENAINTPEDARCLRTQVSQKIKPKGKKKRNNKLPVKILIPATESGEEAREETLMLEMNPENEEANMPMIVMEEPTKQLKLVPVKTLRSSKLKAMAANINKMNDAEDPDSSEDADDVEPKEPESEMTKLEDIFILPDDLSETGTSSDVKKTNNGSNWKSMSGTMNWTKKNTEQNVEYQTSDGDPDSYFQTDIDSDANRNSPANSDSNSKDLSVSRVSPSGKTDASYTREDVDNHLETMQTELENLREVLRGEGYSIDANTLLGLFGADDPMSFGIPVNPELNPQRDRDEDERSTGNSYLQQQLLDNSSYVNAGGELMSYTPSTSLLDFDDDIFLGQTSGNSPSGQIENPIANPYYNNEDSSELNDSKASLLASLVDTNDVNTT